MRAQAILDLWKINLENILIVSRSETELTEIPLHEASRWIDVDGAFDKECTVFLDTKIQSTGKRTIISRLGSSEPLTNVNIALSKTSFGPQIRIGGDNVRVYIGDFGYSFFAELNIWGNSNLVVGDKATCNQARFVMDNSDIIIGRDCMLSDNILLQSNDQHGIISLTDMKIVNNFHNHIRVGEHVWIGRRSMLMPGSTIGRGSIIASGAVVTRNIGEFSICAGVPAKVVRENCSWSRSQANISKDELAFLNITNRNEGTRPVDEVAVNSGV